MAITMEEITRVLVDNDIEVRDFAREDFADRARAEDGSLLKDAEGRQVYFFEGLGNFVEVKQKGGSGQGDEWYVIHYFIDHDVYVRTDGYYSSGHGVDFEDGYGRIVRPQEKVITVYE